MINNGFNIDLVQEDLRTIFIGKTLLHYPTIDSTNAEAKRLLEDGAKNGTVLVADTQTGGRGRLTRTWSSPTGGLWFSVILKTGDLEPVKLPLLSLLAGISVAEAINEKFNINVNLKWPNDIILSDKKLGGILIESVYSGKNLTGIVIGIGLNSNLTISDLPGLLKETVVTLGDSLDISEIISNEIILAGILNSIEANYDLLESSKENVILKRWRALSTTIGSKVAVYLENDEKFVGNALGLTDYGALVIKAEDGIEHTILAGDCLHLRENE